MKLDLHVNLDKTNIVIFRNGGYIAKKEVWYFDGQSISVVNSYKYLGLFLTTRMTFSNAVDEIANEARKGFADISRMLWRLGDFSATIFQKIFDAQMKPMLLYGSEIWGAEGVHVSGEGLYFCSEKSFKCSSKNTTTYCTGRQSVLLCTFFPIRLV